MTSRDSGDGPAAANLWPAPTAKQPVVGRVRVPGSKSLTNRALVIAALSGETSVIRNSLVARDAVLMADGLRALGVSIIEAADGSLNVTAGQLTGYVTIDCGLSGTVMRFLPPLAALADGPVTFTGDEQAKARPTHATTEALRQLEVPISRDGPGSLPFTVQGSGSVTGSNVVIDAHQSSQFVSGILLSASSFSNGVRLHHRGAPLPSIPHVEMTVELLRRAGARIETHTADLTDAAWFVEPSPLHLTDFTIEPDLSNAAAFLAAAMVTGGEVTIQDWPVQTTQAGAAIIDIFGQLGATASRDGVDMTVTGPATLAGADLDLRDVGELVPTIAAVCCFANSQSTLTGIAHLRGHETDRLTALATEINRLGGQATELPDGLVITPRALAGTAIESYHDHRMATFGAIIGLRVSDVTVVDIATTAKTMPDFPSQWSALVGGAKGA